MNLERVLTRGERKYVNVNRNLVVYFILNQILVSNGLNWDQGFGHVCGFWPRDDSIEMIIETFMIKANVDMFSN